MVAPWSALSPQTKKVPGSIPRPFCVECILSVPARVLLGCCSFLPQTKDMQVQSICDSKVPIGIDIHKD